MTGRDRRAAERSGLAAERAAAWLLALKGYRLLDRRYRSPAGEIDLIASRGRRLAFVEVKRRASGADAAWAVLPRQQQRIARAAGHWLARRPAYAGHDIGFDVVLVAPWSLPRHLRDAFRV